MKRTKYLPPEKIMIPTCVFPNLERLYPSLGIVGVKEAWKSGFGWSVNLYGNLSVISQIRNLKEHGFTKVSLLLRNERTKTEFQTDWNISELKFYREVNPCSRDRPKRPLKKVFTLI
jgi:hypothetical protein